MKIFQPKYQAKNGKAKRVQRWYIGFTDNARIRRRLPTFPNKGATERASIMLQELLSSGGSLSATLQKWLEEIPDSMRDRLVEWGVVDARKWSVNLGKNLREHLADYVAGLRADGCGDRHVKQVESYIGKILEGCNLTTWSHVDGNGVKVFLSERRGPEGYGERTFNTYLKEFKSFTAWLIREGRVVGPNPMQNHSPMKQTKFEKVRRWISDDEVRRLLEAAESGVNHHGMSGYERRLAYTLALQTGLRAHEIESLHLSSFDFGANPPFVHIESADAKGKRADDLILIPATAKAIQELLVGKEPQDPAFHIPSSAHTAEMLREDLEPAGIPYTDDAGRDADFHALRHTFITNLSRAGVHPAVAQKLARHSDIRMTMKYYTHVLRESEIAAIEKLAGLSPACLFGAQRQPLTDVGGQRNPDADAKTALSA